MAGHRLLRKIVCFLSACAMLLSSAAQACTGIRLTAEDGTVVHARTMEFAIDIHSDVLMVPRGYARTGLGGGLVMADVTGGQYRLQVQPGVLIQASQDLHAIADELNVAHRRLVGEVEQLLGRSWQGQASGAFGKDWQEFEKGSRGVIEDARARVGEVHAK